MKIGDVIHGRYKIEGLLSQKFGHDRLLATDTSSHTQVVLEYYTGDLTRSRDIVESIRYQIELSSILTGPHFMEFIDSFTNEDSLFIVWKYIDAHPLTKNISLRSLTQRDVCLIIAHCVRALHEAHERSIIHGALSTDSILLTPTLTPIIIDFSMPGASIVTDPGVTDGVNAYRAAAPEIFSGTPVDKYCDYYSIGIIADFLFRTCDTSDSRQDMTLRNARQIILSLASSDRSTRILSVERILDNSFLDELSTPAWGNDAVILSRKQIRAIKRHSLKINRFSDRKRQYLGVLFRFILITTIAISIIIILAKILPRQ